MRHPQQHPARMHRAAEAMCVRLFATYSTLVTTDLLHVAHVVPVGPGPNFPGCTTVTVGGEVMTVVLGGAVGTFMPGGGGLLPKYDGGGAGNVVVDSYGGGKPILFSIVASIVRKP